MIGTYLIQINVELNDGVFYEKIKIKIFSSLFILDVVKSSVVLDGSLRKMRSL